jgi:hypothetical protein
MSDNYLKLVPVDTSFVPTAEAQSAAVSLLRRLAPRADDVNAVASDNVEFVDCGSNWTGVRCPHCAQALDEWWPSAMASAASTAFSNLDVVLPCCGRSSVLTELDYIWPIHFGRFVLQARNAGIDGQLPPGDVSQLESLLGCPLRVVLARH